MSGYSESDLTDVDFFLTNLDTTLFPGVSSNVQAHNGFLAEHAKTASQILTEVKNLISSKGVKQVITVSSFQFRIMWGTEMSSMCAAPFRSDIRWVAHWPSSIRCS